MTSTRRNIVRNVLLVLLVALSALAGVSHASEGYNTEIGAVIGAGLGAIAGQMMSHDMTGTLLGAAGGAVAGAIIGNAVDQTEASSTFEPSERRLAYRVPTDPQEQPPGRWVLVPGQWVGSKWVPSHRTWVPMSPGRARRY